VTIASVFGLVTSLFLLVTGDGSAYQVAQKQPMKLAVMEGLYEGKEGAPLTAIGILTPGKQYDDSKDPYIFKIQIPRLLSWLGYRSGDAFVPGVKDVIEGGYVYRDGNGNERVAPSVEQKMAKGKIAIGALAEYKKAAEAGDSSAMAYHKKLLDENFEYFGYGYLNDPKSVIPNIPLTFYSFHVMVALGFLFIIFFIVMLYLVLFRQFKVKRWLLYLSIVMIPLAFLAGQAGWIVTEVGRQPWVIQDVLPTVAAISRIDTSAVQITFFLFLAIFTALLIAELRIMFKQIKIGPKEGGK
ncbi:MAG TPA: cytochrome ubiquinol oxidase subunit I, partial [Tenuifilaceae bacterium]|nr:cytochrome ubiquinol oxidase subunit I [Tenuifilaceae bacterium]